MREHGFSITVENMLTANMVTATMVTATMVTANMPTVLLKYYYSADMFIDFIKYLEQLFGRAPPRIYF